MDKKKIVEEIKRTAKDNNGIPLGIRTFFKETGIKESDWKGRYWARWGDAIQEAGFTPNELSKALPEEYLIEKLIGLIRELKRFPVKTEIAIKARNDSTFPSLTTFFKYRSKSKLVSKTIDFCQGRQGYEDVLQICLPLLSSNAKNDDTDSDDPSDNGIQLGYVYLIKSGKHFKIGRSNAAGRREYELAIQLPDKAETIHKIQTDDPPGIEAYWHKRFAEKRKNGEWFELDSSDVKVFRRRKFM